VARDGDYHTRDLFTAIKNGDFPSWTLYMQIMPFAEAETYRCTRLFGSNAACSICAWLSVGLRFSISLPTLISG
jgi:hypothetical protein